jgi:uncharacterized metal-binding protein
MAENKVCSGGPKLIFACSGAADVGAVADQAARKLSKEGLGSMFCSNGLGGNVEPILNKTKSASKILAIDGCPLNCMKKSLENAGFTVFEHLQLADLGLEKGKSPANEENVSKAYNAATKML